MLLAALVLGAGLHGTALAQDRAKTTLIACASSLTTSLQAALGPDESVAVIPGSTGKLAQQIEQGAPYDMFLAADAMRTKRLQAAGVAERCNEVGRGVLVAWSATQVADNWSTQPLSLAEPRLAPYGLAAQQALQKMQIWDENSTQFIRGQNVAQAMQFAASGHVPTALISLEQARAAPQGSFVIIDPTSYSPIVHQLCLLKRANQPARQRYSRLLAALRTASTQAREENTL